MKHETAASPEPAIIHEWTARKMQPIVLVYLMLVFLVFIAMAHFVFHSRAAVKSLVVAGVGGVLPLAANVFARFEYRFTAIGLEKRKSGGTGDREYRTVFRWDETERVRPGRHAFKFSRAILPGNAWQRFWRRHLSDAYSGEFHVESGDREAVLAVLAGRGLIEEADPHG